MIVTLFYVTTYVLFKATRHDKNMQYLLRGVLWNWGSLEAVSIIAWSTRRLTKTKVWILFSQESCSNQLVDPVHSEPVLLSMLGLSSRTLRCSFLALVNSIIEDIRKMHFDLS